MISLIKVNVRVELLSGLGCICVVVALILGSTVNAQAILTDPDQNQIEQALKRGADFAQQHRPPNELYSHFGSTEKFEPDGFLVTKVSGLAVMAGHYALRGEQPTDQDIERVLAEEALQVVVTVYGDSPGFARDSYLLLKQADQIIKPHRIRFDARARTVVQHRGAPIFRAKIVGLFSYGTFDPGSRTTLLVFPGVGGEIRFDLDLSTIP